MTPDLYLLLGSNVGDRAGWLRTGQEGIASRIGTIAAQSAVFETAPWGLPDQAAFLNQAIRVEVPPSLTPARLLEAIHTLEAEAGRERTGRWEARTLDIDILLWGSRVIDSETLRVPHPELPRRRFALAPLSQIAPRAVHPLRGQTVAEMLEACADPLPVAVYGRGAGEPAARKQHIAVEGVIGAGKTTLATKLAAHYGVQPLLEAFSDNPFLPRFYADPAHYALPVELHFLADRHAQMLHAARAAEWPLVADYTFRKCLLFAEVTLAAEEAALYRRLYHLAAPALPLPDVIVYLHAEVGRLQANIRQRGRSFEQAIPDDYLVRLAGAYEAWLRSAECPVLHIDTAMVDYLGDSAAFDQLLQAINNAEGQGVVPFSPA